MEIRVLACLLERDIEAYQAININQNDFDLTVVLSPTRVVRVQVKSTELNNKATNNAIDRIDKQYDYLVVVIFGDKEAPVFFVMSKAEAMQLKGINKQLGVTQITSKVPEVKTALLPHEDEIGRKSVTHNKKNEGGRLKQGCFSDKASTRPNQHVVAAYLNVIISKIMKTADTRTILVKIDAVIKWR